MQGQAQIRRGIQPNHRGAGVKGNQLIAVLVQGAGEGIDHLIGQLLMGDQQGIHRHHRQVNGGHGWTAVVGSLGNHLGVEVG